MIRPVRVDEFLDELPTLWRGDPQYQDAPVDRRFRDVIKETRGMATENKLALLNLAATFLDADEIYLEIGAYRGTTIIGAALGNNGRQFVTIDDFSQFKGTLDECNANLSRYSCQNVTLINGNAWQVLNDFATDKSIGVYFYDGRHMFRDHWAALEKIQPFLSDHALVVVDDTSIRRVAAANRLYAKAHPQFVRVLTFSSSMNGEPRWWNGIELYRFDRSVQTTQRSVLKERTSYFAHLVAYDLIRHYLGIATEPFRRLVSKKE
ncbi:MAG TPA: class I SAM-dependent methyltransferase [Chloroflexota bacterium]|nr:class I SAM-dependent methyltransferase [Chloroflexota bacterium]